MPRRINEELTRKEMIDPQLEEAGWYLRDHSKVKTEIPVDGYDAEPWNGISDYTLYRENGEVLAVVEAKKTAVDVRLAEAQLTHYVTEIEKHQSFRPFGFLANGLEIHFVDLGIARALDMGGRAAVIVPDGVLFGSSRAHVEIRKRIIEENRLDGVVSMPSGVFKPYAGVSTAVLFFTRGAQTRNIWFYDMAHDGFSLDEKILESHLSCLLLHSKLSNFIFVLCKTYSRLNLHIRLTK
jgi:hypothetical protein